MNTFKIGSHSFEWNDKKAITNKEKHGIDFADAAKIFGGDLLDIPSENRAENRRLAIGVYDARLMTIVYTMRGDVIRIISARRTRDDERRAYCSLYPIEPS